MTVAILVSGAIALTLTPMMLRPVSQERQGQAARPPLSVLRADVRSDAGRL
ncbi:MAG: hypothetical protein WDO24_14575 [Pseudomonadota bacterium]